MTGLWYYMDASSSKGARMPPVAPNLNTKSLIERTVRVGTPSKTNVVNRQSPKLLRHPLAERSAPTDLASLLFDFGQLFNHTGKDDAAWGASGEGSALDEHADRPLVAVAEFPAAHDVLVARRTWGVVESCVALGRAGFRWQGLRLGGLPRGIGGLLLDGLCDNECCRGSQRRRCGGTQYWG